MGREVSGGWWVVRGEERGVNGVYREMLVVLLLLLIVAMVV